MTLTDADAVDLGRAALRLLDLDGEVHVSEPDPMGDGSAVEVALSQGDWGEFVQFGRDAGRVEAVHRIADQITEYISESREFWGQQFPRCPGHSHPAGYAADEQAIWLRCPQAGVEFRRVTV